MSRTNTALVEHCKKALNEKWGYVYGTFGTVLTESMLQSKLKQYPSNVNQFETFIRSNWMGKRVADCVGLIKSFLWWNGTNPVYNVNEDKSADGMYNSAREKGPLSTMPELPGICLWKTGHIGIYIGNGQVIEARGTRQGVIQSPLRGSGSAGWTHWLKCPYIEYEKTEMSLKDAADTLKKLEISNSPEYWVQNAVPGKMIKGEFAASLILNFAKYIKEGR